MMKSILFLTGFFFIAFQFSSCTIRETPKDPNAATEEIEAEKQADRLEAESEASKTLKDLRKKESQEELQRIQRSITEIEPVQS